MGLTGREMGTLWDHHKISKLKRPVKFFTDEVLEKMCVNPEELRVRSQWPWHKAKSDLHFGFWILIWILIGVLDSDLYSDLNSGF